MTSWFSNSSEKKLQEEINCRQSVKSIINEIRHDYKDKYVPFGEFVDNSFDWGKANYVKVILHKNKIILIDNGNGINSERLKQTLIMGSENKNVQRGTIGKFGLGLKKGSIILGNKISVYTYSGNDYLYTQADWLEMGTNNSLIPVCTEMKEHEIYMFTKYIQQIPSNEGKGTIIIIENLESTFGIDNNFYQKLISYFRQLYWNMESRKYKIEIVLDIPKHKRHATIKETYDPCLRHLFDKTSRENNGIDRFTIIIYNKNSNSLFDDDNSYDNSGRLSILEWNDMKYLCPNTKPNALLKRDQLDLFKKNCYSEQDFTILCSKYTELCRLDVCATYLDDNDMSKEKENFPTLTWEQRMGIYFYRGYRNLSGFCGKKFNLSYLTQKKMYRGRGIRIDISFPANVIDIEMGVTSLKMINEETYLNMPNYISYPIAMVNYQCNKRHERMKKKLCEKAKELIDKNIEIVNNAIKVSDINKIKDLDIWFTNIYKNNIITEFGFEIDGKNAGFQKIFPILEKIKNFLKIKEEEEQIKSSHDFFCKKNLKKLCTITSIKKIQNLISNYNKKFINYSYLSHEFNNKCEEKIYELNQEVRREKYFTNYNDIQSTENYNKEKLQNLKRLLKDISEEKNKNFFSEIKNKVQKLIENFPKLLDKSDSDSDSSDSDSDSSDSDIPPPLPLPPKNYYHDSMIVLTELTSIFNERTICSEDILLKLKELRDLLN